MAATRVDNFPTTSTKNTFKLDEVEKLKESEPSNFTDSARGHGASGDGAGVAPSHDQQAKCQPFHLTSKTIGILSVTIAAITVFTTLVAVVMVLGIWIWHLQAELQNAVVRLDSLETQCSNKCISVTEGSGPDAQLNNSELLHYVSEHLSQLDSETQTNVSTLWQTISLIQEIHASDTVQARLNASLLLIQFDSLSNSLLSLADETVSNVTQLKKFIEIEAKRIHNHSLTVAQSVSVLADRVTMLENKSHELQGNVTDLEATLKMKLETIMGEFRTRLLELAMNISRNEEYLRDLSSTQVDHTASILGLAVNISMLEEHMVERLEHISETFTSTVSGVEQDVSQIDASHTAQLQNLSLVQDSLYNELMINKEAFLANTSALKHLVAELGKDIAYTDDLLMNLTSNHEELHNDLYVSKETFSSNLSTLEQGLEELLANLSVTNKKLNNLSVSQNTLQLDLSVAKEELLANISTAKWELDGEINRTQAQLQSISSRQTELHLNIIATEETLLANVSILQSGLEDVDGDLALTTLTLRNLSYLYNGFQTDLATTRAILQQNASHLHSLIYNVEHNHSLLLSDHSRALQAMEMNASVLTRRMDSGFQMLMAQGQRTTVINSTVSAMDRHLTSVNHTLSSQIEQRVGQLGTRIDDHIDWIRRLFSEQSLTLDRFGDRIHQVELKLSGAPCNLPFGLVDITAISGLVLFVAM